MVMKTDNAIIKVGILTISFTVLKKDVFSKN